MYKYILTKDNLVGGNYTKDETNLLKNNTKFISDKEILLQCDSSIKYNDIYPHHERVYAIGDIHGDLEAFMVLMEEVCKVCKFNCKIRDNKNIESHNDIEFKWIGKNSYVVLVGDTIDRKREGSIEKDGLLVGEIPNEEIILINLINRIALAANNEGGKLIKLLGNHEIMNLYSNFNYVSDNTLKENRGHYNRSNIIGPNGDLANKIIKCGTLGIVKIGDWIFVHGGLLPALVSSVKETGVTNFIHKSNSLARKIFLNKLTDLNSKDKKLVKYYFIENNIKKRKLDDYNNEEEYTQAEIESLYKERDSMLNERRLSIDNYGGIKVPISEMCSALRHTFKLLGYPDNQNIVVAHSVQLERGLFKRSNTDPGYVSGYVYKNLESQDNKRLVYIGPGEKYTTKLLKNNINNVFPHGLNFECPHNSSNNKLGQLWRIDTGVSRGFDNEHLKDASLPKSLLEKILKARRPSALEILYDKKKGYTTKVLVAKKGLTRPWLKTREECYNNRCIIDTGPIFE